MAFEKSFFEKKLLSGQRVYRLKNGVAEMNEVKLAACSTFLQTMSQVFRRRESICEEKVLTLRMEFGRLRSA
jgi:hypothetical protein